MSPHKSPKDPALCGGATNQERKPEGQQRTPNRSLQVDVATGKKEGGSLHPPAVVEPAVPKLGRSYELHYVGIWEKMLG